MSTAVALVAAVALVVGAFVTTAGGGAGHTARRANHPAVITPESINARAIAAIAAVQDNLFHSRTVANGTSSDVWVDPTGGSYEVTTSGADGAPLRVSAFLGARAGGEAEALQINYSTKTYATPAVVPGVSFNFPNPAKMLQSELASQPPASQSETTLNGQQATLLTWSDGDSIWIDTSTGLPLQQTAKGATSTYDWPVRTSDQVAAMWPTIPAGFTHAG